MDEPTEPTTPAPPAAADGSPPPAPPAPAPAGRSDHAFRIARWTLGLGVTLVAAGALAWAGLLLTVFGLGGIALAAGVLLTLTGAFVWRRGMLPLAVLAVAVTLPAAGATLQSLRVDRSVGLLQVRPASTAELDERTTYRRGAGTVFVDLRDVTLPTARPTRIAARADLGPVIVALGREQCIQTTIRYRYRARYGDLFTDGATTAIELAGLDNGTRDGVTYNSTGLTEAAALQDAQRDYERSPSAYGLLAWGRLPDAASERYLPDGRIELVHGAAEPGAARLELDLEAGQQIVVRDYPDSAAPLDTNFGEQISGQSWPAGATPPRSPDQLHRRGGRMAVRTHANRAAWTRWERRVIAWGTEQARRFAGHCATTRELRRRAYAFDTQPESVRVDSGRVQQLTGDAATRRSPIKGQPVGRSENFRLRVEVNGLGETRVLGQFRGNEGYYPSVDDAEEIS